MRRIKKLIRDCKQEAETNQNVENQGQNSLSASSPSTLVSQSDPELISGRRSESVFKPSSEITSRGPLSSIDVTTHGMVPAMGALDLPPSLSILPPQRNSLSPASGTMGMLQQPLHMAAWAQTNSMPQSPPPLQLHTIAIPGGLPTQHGSLSRALVNTMGKLGRWRRVLNSRSAPVQSQLDCSGVSSFDIEHGYPADLQSLRQHSDVPYLIGQQNSLSVSHADVIPTVDQQQSRLSDVLSTLEETTESDADGKTPQPSILLPKKDTLPPFPADQEDTSLTVGVNTTDKALEGRVAEDPHVAPSEEATSENGHASVEASLPNDPESTKDAASNSLRHSSSSSLVSDSVAFLPSETKYLLSNPP